MSEEKRKTREEYGLWFEIWNSDVKLPKPRKIYIYIVYNFYDFIFFFSLFYSLKYISYIIS